MKSSQLNRRAALVNIGRPESFGAVNLAAGISPGGMATLMRLIVFLLFGVSHGYALACVQADSSISTEIDDDGLLVVQAKNVPALAILHALAEHQGLEPVVWGSPPAECVSVSVSGATVEDVARRVFRNISYVIKLEPQEKALEILFLENAKTSGERMEQQLDIDSLVSIEDHKVPQQLGALSRLDQSVEERVAAILNLSDDSLDRDDRVMYLELVNDPDSRIRALAIELLDLEDNPVPFDYLVALIQSDPDPDIKINALDRLANRYRNSALPYIRAALADPHADVRMHAKDLLVSVPD